MEAMFALLLALQDFDGVDWDGAAPDLKGKVAIVRWWTSGCHLCETSAPVLAALAKTGGKVAPAAELLGISRHALHRRLKRYGLRGAGGDGGGTGD